MYCTAVRCISRAVDIDAAPAFVQHVRNMCAGRHSLLAAVSSREYCYIYITSGWYAAPATFASLRRSYYNIHPTAADVLLVVLPSYGPVRIRTTTDVGIIRRTPTYSTTRTAADLLQYELFCTAVLRNTKTGKRNTIGKLLTRRNALLRMS